MLLIIGMSLFSSHVMSYLHISQPAAQGVANMHLWRWLLVNLAPLKAPVSTWACVASS